MNMGVKAVNAMKVIAWREVGLTVDLNINVEIPNQRHVRPVDEFVRQF